jgi:hypothetical protein
MKVDQEGCEGEENGTEEIFADRGMSRILGSSTTENVVANKPGVSLVPNVARLIILPVVTCRRLVGPCCLLCTRHRGGTMIDG